MIKLLTFMPLVMVEFPLKGSHEMCELSNTTNFKKESHEDL